MTPMAGLGASLEYESIHEKRPFLYRYWWKIGAIAALLVVSLYAIHRGIGLRRQVYDQTMNIHFSNDARNAYMWGRNAMATGLFNLYEATEQYNLQAVYGLDYTPLRLTAAMQWHAWTRRNYPGPPQFRRDFDFLSPMLWGNTIAALISSILTFLLVRMWIIRMDDAQRTIDQPPRPFRGVFMGMLGALLLWFNPGALWDGYAWGQWEIWIIPFYLGAVYLACLDRWFAAGACLAVGALLKPQLLVAAPVLVIWPICQLRFGALFRLISGLAFALMTIAFPWLRSSPEAYFWYSLMLVALAALAVPILRLKFSSAWFMAISVIALLLVWPWQSNATIGMRLLPGAMIVVMILLSRVLPTKLLPHVYAMAIALAIFLMIPLFDASTAWFRYGFVKGPAERPYFYQFPMYNVPAMLGTYFRWTGDNEMLVQVPLLGKTMTAWSLMLLLHGICLVLCGIGAAIHDRKRDSRFLLAIFLPWFTLYMFLTQLQSRYLMWAAVASALLAGVGWGWTLMSIVISYLCYVSIDQNLHDAAGIGLSTTSKIPAPHPGLLLLLMTLVMLYVAVMPRQKYLSR